MFSSEKLKNFIIWFCKNRSKNFFPCKFWQPTLWEKSSSLLKRAKRWSSFRQKPVIFHNFSCGCSAELGKIGKSWRVLLTIFTPSPSTKIKVASKNIYLCPLSFLCVYVLCVCVYVARAFLCHLLFGCFIRVSLCTTSFRYLHNHFCVFFSTWFFFLHRGWRSISILTR